ncbi:hypothetical protein [Chitinophaga deserti]|uniref:hypothetical protein n=1 Tax=Chitinophaga deserti TaxID=2164099 RepID=UPI000D6CEC08|nr:hypothetical protein [Chitinophaga deserti]
MLQTIDYLEDILRQQHQAEEESSPGFYASELQEMLGYTEEAMHNALVRAMQACAALKMPLSLNFRRIYCWQSGEMLEDWQLSRLAGYLLIVNSDPRNPAIAQAQWFLFRKSYSF